MTQLIDMLQQDGLIDAIAADRARAAVSQGRPLEQAILSADGVTEEAMLRALAASLDLPFVELETAAPDKEFVSQFPPD